MSDECISWYVEHFTLRLVSLLSKARSTWRSYFLTGRRLQPTPDGASLNTEKPFLHRLAICYLRTLRPLAQRCLSIPLALSSKYAEP